MSGQVSRGSAGEYQANERAGVALEKAKINKHITFHCFRHTYASLQLELGTDIYTVQKILAHANVSTTEIYARHAEPKKREAAKKFSLKTLKSIIKKNANK